jgi:hypothetical protein
MNSRNTSIIALSAALALTAVAKVWADDVCTPCLCTGNGSCQGCQNAFADKDCETASDPVYVDVPPNSFYNYCEPSSKEEDVCLPHCQTCFVAKTFSDFYSGEKCVTAIGALAVDHYVFVYHACEP